MKRRRQTLFVGLSIGLTACVGTIGDGDSTLSSQAADEVGVAGLRRLSVGEYQTTVFDLLGVDAATAKEIMPVDTLVPFDNDYTTQTASEALIKGAEVLSGDLADAVIADPALRANVVGCEPTSALDEVCFRSFIVKFGRRALRRPLTSEEVEKFVGLLQFASPTQDFWVGVSAAIRAFLQHPEFLYRVEIGAPVDGQPDLHLLNGFEVGTRLSYFLIGTTPPDWLLDAEEAGQLDAPEGIAAAATKLFEDDRARGRMGRFHAMWLSYAQLTDAGLSGQMLDETQALLDRVIFDEKLPWTEVLASEETFVTPELATHYGLAPPDAAAGGWVSYGDSGRKGLFSQGTFLSAVGKFGDTSPTQRGRLIRTRLFCETIEKPPPALMVNVDMPPMVPDPNACKKERYYMSHEEACASCHSLMDPIGFGLEAYDASGAFRTTERNRTDCPIDGEGEFVGLGTFNGPAALADLAVGSGRVEACVAKQLYRFAVGHVELDEHDQALIDRVVHDTAAGGGLKLDAFIATYVGSEAFRYRRDEVSQ